MTAPNSPAVVITMLLPLLVLSLLVKSQEVPTPPKPDTLDASSAPSVLVVLLVRSKASALPYVLGALERQHYPRQRVSLWIHEDHSLDESARLLTTWRDNHLAQGSAGFRSIHLEVSATKDGVNGSAMLPTWSRQRFAHVMALRQAGLDFARQSKFDRVLLLDADVVLASKNALQYLVEAGDGLAVLAPLLNCTGGGSEGLAYANFWGAMDERGFYKRSDDYILIKRREKIGVLNVPMVHTALMVNLRHADSAKVQFGEPKPSEKYTGPFDDVIIFGLRARQRGLKLYLDNRIFFGYFTEPQQGLSLKNEQEFFRNLLMEAMLEQSEVEQDIQPSATAFLDTTWSSAPAKHRYGFDRVYLINLARRTERRQKMEFNFKLLGMEVERFEAIDANTLNATHLLNMGVRQLPGYIEHYFNRGLNLGQVANFLSHVRIWEKIANTPNLNRAIIFEDDVRFDPLFDSILKSAVTELGRLKPDWEFLYLGRKINRDTEKMLFGANYLALPHYTAWSLSYAITKQGAQKLLAEQPLTKMVALDNFISIMFDQHPQTAWKARFSQRNLTALTVAPLIVEPTHYPGHKHFVSDVEHGLALCNQADGSSNINAAAIELCGTPPLLKTEL